MHLDYIYKKFHIHVSSGFSLTIVGQFLGCPPSRFLMTDQISKEWFTYPPATNNAMGHRHFRQIIICDFHLDQPENMNETDRIVNPSNMIFLSIRVLLLSGLHGVSLKTFYRRMQKEGPSLLLIQADLRAASGSTEGCRTTDLFMS